MKRMVWLAGDEAGFYKKAAHTFLESVVEAVRDHKRATIALSGGSTPKKLFQTLCEPYYRERIPWADLAIFWVDERCVPPQHQDSNYGSAHSLFLSRVPIPQNHIYRMPGETKPPHEGARAYENTLKAFFNLTLSPPQFDLILLGVGEDGHTASLFPKSEALNDTHHLVAATYVEKLTSHRLTLTFPVINNAKRVLFLCNGASKAEVVRDIFRDDISPTRYPAQMVKPVGELIWLLDKEAASKISTAVRYEALHV